MDWSWLTGLFSSLWNILKKIVRLKWSDLWREFQNIIQRLRNWYKWYQDNVQKNIQQARARFRQIYDQFVLPIVKVVDTIRRITSLVGLFNKRLAAKLNLLFLRVEGKLLEPLNLYNQRLNRIGATFSGFLTPLGYFDRATLDNTVWRDVRQLREIFRNPLAGTIPKGTLNVTPTFDDQNQLLTQYLASGSGDLEPRISDAMQRFHTYIGL